jgi:hypothetical protein
VVDVLIISEVPSVIVVLSVLLIPIVAVSVLDRLISLLVSLSMSLVECNDDDDDSIVVEVPDVLCCCSSIAVVRKLDCVLLSVPVVKLGV